MYVIVYLFTQSALKFWTRSRKNRGRCMVNISALCGNYFRLLRRFFPAANRAAPAGWTWSGRGQEIPLWFHRPHFWNLHDPRIKMIYNMSLFFLFQFLVLIIWGGAASNFFPYSISSILVLSNEVYNFILLKVAKKKLGMNQNQFCLSCGYILAPVYSLCYIILTECKSITALVKLETFTIVVEIYIRSNG